MLEPNQNLERLPKRLPQINLALASVMGTPGVGFSKSRLSCLLSQLVLKSAFMGLM